MHPQSGAAFQAALKHNRTLTHFNFQGNQWDINHITEVNRVLARNRTAKEQQATAVLLRSRAEIQQQKKPLEGYVERLPATRDELAVEETYAKTSEVQSKRLRMHQH